MNPQTVDILAGSTALVTFTVQVRVPVPVAQFSYMVNGLTVQVDARSTTALPNAVYTWSWGEGTINAAGVSVVILEVAGPVASHTYLTDGPHNIALNVGDAGGHSTARQQVTTTFPPPLPALTPIPLVLGRMAQPWNTYMVYAPNHVYVAGDKVMITGHSAVPSVNGVPWYVGGVGGGLAVLFRDSVLTPLVVTQQGVGGSIRKWVLYPLTPIVSGAMTGNGNTYQVRAPGHGLATGQSVVVVGHGAVPSLTGVPLWVKVVTVDFVTLWKDAALTQVVSATSGTGGTIQRV